MNEMPSDAVLQEHRFWLQIMGDHARFVYHALAPNETGELFRVKPYILLFDNLTLMAQRPAASAADDLPAQALKNTQDFYALLLQLLSLTLSGQLTVGLSSTCFNHMLNETEEYLLTLESMKGGTVPLFYPVHYHVLWLSDAAGHASAVLSGLDETERDFIKEGGDFQRRFTGPLFEGAGAQRLYSDEASELPGDGTAERTGGGGDDGFPDLSRVGARDLRRDGSLLGTLMPIAADHMAREACYYLQKLSLAVGNLKNIPE